MRRAAGHTGGNAAHNGGSSYSALEEENDRLVSDLNPKVATLKHESELSEPSDSRAREGVICDSEKVSKEGSDDLEREDGYDAKLSIEINSEIKEQNRMLSEMDDDFGKSGGFLEKTMGRLQKMAKAGHNCYILYLILFCMFVFFILWLIIKTR